MNIAIQQDALYLIGDYFKVTKEFSTGKKHKFLPGDVLYVDEVRIKSDAIKALVYRNHETYCPTTIPYRVFDENTEGIPEIECEYVGKSYKIIHDTICSRRLPPKNSSKILSVDDHKDSTFSVIEQCQGKWSKYLKLTKRGKDTIHNIFVDKSEFTKNFALISGKKKSALKVGQVYITNKTINAIDGIVQANSMVEIHAIGSNKDARISTRCYLTSERDRYISFAWRDEDEFWEHHHKSSPKSKNKAAPKGNDVKPDHEHLVGSEFLVIPKSGIGLNGLGADSGRNLLASCLDTITVLKIKNNLIASVSSNKRDENSRFFLDASLGSLLSAIKDGHLQEMHTVMLPPLAKRLIVGQTYALTKSISDIQSGLTTQVGNLLRIESVDDYNVVTYMLSDDGSNKKGRVLVFEKKIFLASSALQTIQYDSSVMVGDKYQVIKEMALCDNNYVIAGVILEVIKIQNSFVLVQSVSSKITPISVATAVLHAHSVKIDKSKVKPNHEIKIGELYRVAKVIVLKNKPYECIELGTVLDVVEIKNNLVAVQYVTWLNVINKKVLRSDIEKDVLLAHTTKAWQVKTKKQSKFSEGSVYNINEFGARYFGFPHKENRTLTVIKYHSSGYDVSCDYPTLKSPFFVTKSLFSRIIEKKEIKTNTETVIEIGREYKLKTQLPTLNGAILHPAGSLILVHEVYDTCAVKISTHDFENRLFYQWVSKNEFLKAIYGSTTEEPPFDYEDIVVGRSYLVTHKFQYWKYLDGIRRTPTNYTSPLTFAEIGDIIFVSFRHQSKDILGITVPSFPTPVYCYADDFNWCTEYHATDQKFDVVIDKIDGKISEGCKTVKIKLEDGNVAEDEFIHCPLGRPILEDVVLLEDTPSYSREDDLIMHLKHPIKKGTMVDIFATNSDSWSAAFWRNGNGEKSKWAFVKTKEIFDAIPKRYRNVKTRD